MPALTRASYLSVLVVLFINIQLKTLSVNKNHSEKAILHCCLGVDSELRLTCLPFGKKVA